MIVIISHGPYDGEYVLGGLSIAATMAKEDSESFSNENGMVERASCKEKVSVYFVEDGLYCLTDIDSSLNHIEEADSFNQKGIYLVSDIVRQLYGLVNLYYIPSERPDLVRFSCESPKEMREKGLLYFVKKATYDHLADAILKEKEPKNILVF